MAKATVDQDLAELIEHAIDLAYTNHTAAEDLRAVLDDFQTRWILRTLRLAAALRECGVN